MKIAIASCLQESNNFSPVATTYDDFNPVFGPAVLHRHRGKLTEMGGFLDVLDATEATIEPITIEPICAAWAITANRCRRADFARLTKAFAAGLAAANPDALLLAMHGAQT
ncbi:MAG: M81 family metallopeptidase, partial [Acidobacteriota bacterium]